MLDFGLKNRTDQIRRKLKNEMPKQVRHDTKNKFEIENPTFEIKIWD